MSVIQHLVLDVCFSEVLEEIKNQTQFWLYTIKEQLIEPDLTKPFSMHDYQFSSNM
jgi:hypothetical protein